MTSMCQFAIRKGKLGRIAIGRLEEALRLIQSTQPMVQKLKVGKTITQDENDRLLKAIAAHHQAIQVDSFSMEEYFNPLAPNIPTHLSDVVSQTHDIGNLYK
ncbi:MAG: hypothetical protein HC810_01005 [Acaryochloridaceae cyanobacterium RL_2_7]|nr:hypothetical protein [Acaryochloridaceae cyanobacterium RL_2_7]